MLKAVVNNLLTIKVIAIAVSWIFGYLGAHQYKYRVLFKAGALPDLLEIHLPEKIFSINKLIMKSMNGRDQVARTVAMRGWHAFEHPMPNLFVHTIKKDSCVLDIGANTGYYSLLAAAVEDSVKVHAFEPVPYIIDILVDNMALNGLSNDRVEINKQAVASESGQVKFYMPTGEHGLIETSGSLNRKFRAQHEDTLNVEVTTVDNYVDLHRIAKLDVIKIDIESMDHIVLDGAMDTLKNHRPVVFCEVLAQANFKALNQVITAVDYVSVHMSEGKLNVQKTVCSHPSILNQLFWPRENILKLEELAKRLNYSFNK